MLPPGLFERSSAMSHPLDGDGASTPPFDTARADALMEACGIDVMLVCSKHNVAYLLGG